MRRVTMFVWAGAIVALSAAPAGADGFITPYVGYNFGGDSANCASLTSCQEKHANFGVSLGTLGPVGFEEDIAWATDFFVSAPGVENNIFTAMSNLLISIPAGPIQPYVVGGLGLVRPHVALDFPFAKISSDDNAIGYDLGGGVNAFLSRHAGVRGDIRHLHTLQDVGVFRLSNIFKGQRLDFWRASVGLTLRF